MGIRWSFFPVASSVTMIQGSSLEAPASFSGAPAIRRADSTICCAFSSSSLERAGVSAGAEAVPPFPAWEELQPGTAIRTSGRTREQSLFKVSPGVREGGGISADSLNGSGYGL